MKETLFEVLAMCRDCAGKILIEITEKDRVLKIKRYNGDIDLGYEKNIVCGKCEAYFECVLIRHFILGKERVWVTDWFRGNHFIERWKYVDYRPSGLLIHGNKIW